MNIEIELNGRMSANLEAICEVQGVTPEEYCFDAVRQRMDIDRFGDLNEVVGTKKDERLIEATPVVETLNEEAKVSQKSDKFVTETPQVAVDAPQKPKTGRRTIKVKTKSDD